MAYTFLTKVAPTEPGEEDNFGGLTVDGNHQAMSYGAGPQMSDATASPQTSPLTVSNSSATTLLVPTNAVKLTIVTLTNTLNISESVSAVSSKYFTLPVGTVLSIDVSRCSTLYLEANTGSATVSFFFTIV